jgi:hypothetical protein
VNYTICQKQEPSHRHNHDQAKTRRNKQSLQALLDNIVGDGGDGLHLEVLKHEAVAGANRLALGLGDGNYTRGKG